MVLLILIVIHSQIHTHYFHIIIINQTDNKKRENNVLKMMFIEAASIHIAGLRDLGCDVIMMK